MSSPVSPTSRTGRWSCSRQPTRSTRAVRGSSIRPRDAPGALGWTAVLPHPVSARTPRADATITLAGGTAREGRGSSPRDRVRRLERNLAQAGRDRAGPAGGVRAALAELAGQRRGDAGRARARAGPAPGRYLALAAAERGPSPSSAGGRRGRIRLGGGGGAGVVDGPAPGAARDPRRGGAAVPGPDPGGRHDLEPASAAVPGGGGGIGRLPGPGAARRRTGVRARSAADR